MCHIPEAASVHVKVLFFHDNIMEGKKIIATHIHALVPPHTCWSWVLINMTPLKATGGKFLIWYGTQGLLYNPSKDTFLLKLNLLGVE
jgi:hypothetical protein